MNQKGSSTIWGKKRKRGRVIIVKLILYSFLIPLNLTVEKGKGGRCYNLLDYFVFIFDMSQFDR